MANWTPLRSRVEAFHSMLADLAREFDGSMRGEVLKIVASELRHCIDDEEGEAPRLATKVYEL